MKNVLGTRLIAKKISYLVSNRNPCLQITLKNAHAKKKTNVEKQRTCFKRWILTMIALSNDDSNDECIRTECIPAKRRKLLSSYTPSLYKRKHTW